LISGGAGYIGTELTKYLLQKYNVIVYDKFYFLWLKKNKNKLKSKNKLQFIKKDINAVEAKDFNKVDIVCDLNGISNDPSSELNPKYTWEINYKSRLKFAKLAKKAGVKRYIFNSTCSVYGFNKKKVFENSGKNPLSTYAKANLAAEKEIYKLRNTSFKVNILRNATLFGFSNTMRLDLVINIFVLNLINRKKIFIDGDGMQFRPFISVHDILKVYEKIISNNSFSSFICNLVSFNSTVKSIAYKICKILKINNKNILFNDKFFDKRNYIVGSKNFKKIFGSNFKFSSFEKEILNLKKNILKYKVSVNTKTIRMKFYKKLFH
jgi:nucleoside-diphosphate-sugar epimerase